MVELPTYLPTPSLSLDRSPQAVAWIRRHVCGVSPALLSWLINHIAERVSHHTAHALSIPPSVAGRHPVLISRCLDWLSASAREFLFIILFIVRFYEYLICRHNTRNPLRDTYPSYLHWYVWEVQLQSTESTRYCTYQNTKSSFL